MSHCYNKVYCTLHDCICGCAGCNPLKPGQLTWSGFRQLLKDLERDGDLSPVGHKQITAAIDLEIVRDPTDQKFIDEVVARSKMMDARRASGACMAVSSDIDGNDVWCCLPGTHTGPHKVSP